MTRASGIAHRPEPGSRWRGAQPLADRGRGTADASRGRSRTRDVAASTSRGEITGGTVRA